MHFPALHVLTECGHGSNIGWFTVLAASHNCAVTAFEPFPANLLLMHQSIALNGLQESVVVEPVVATDRPDAALVLHEMPFAPTLGWVGMASDERFDKVPSTPVNSARIDDIICRAQDRSCLDSLTVPLLKIDVEGCELDVLSSARELFSKATVLNMLIEINPGDWSRCDPVRRPWRSKYHECCLDESWLNR